MTWLIATRYHAEGGRDVATYFGAAILILAGWIAAASAGYFLGRLVVACRANLRLPARCAKSLRLQRRSVGGKCNHVRGGEPLGNRSHDFSAFASPASIFEIIELPEDVGW